jgi:dimethylhistidine N-methyltransferase
MDQSFAQDVDAGFSAPRKFLHSKYFYDAKGDELFQRIMHLEEYYLTNCEREIFQTYRAELLGLFTNPIDTFQILEFGAGDGTKTKILLEYFLEAHADFTYSPIDISGSVLHGLGESLKKELPDLHFKGIQGDYFEVLKQFGHHANDTRNIVFFLGSNIGNFDDQVRHSFLENVRKNLEVNDLLMVGYDLKKDPATILAAYNDREGVTRAFNFNLLDRINRELEGNIDLDNFIHYPFYNPSTGESRSYLISKKDQQVYLKALDKTYEFERWESIFTEVSRKFNLSEIRKMGSMAGFEVLEIFHDSREYFAEVVFKAI